jgi:hypothetical protein
VFIITTDGKRTVKGANADKNAPVKGAKRGEGVGVVKRVQCA